MARAGARGTSAARGGQSPQTRAALVAAAIAALRDVGFAGASAREIARRAACNPALVFYHFGSVTDLLLAALDDVSDRRLAAYRGLLNGPRSLAELVHAARAIFVEDLDAGHVSVLVEMISGAQWTPGLREQSRPGWRRGGSLPRPRYATRCPVHPPSCSRRRKRSRTDSWPAFWVCSCWHNSTKTARPRLISLVELSCWAGCWDATGSFGVGDDERGQRDN